MHLPHFGNSISGRVSYHLGSSDGDSNWKRNWKMKGKLDCLSPKRQTLNPKHLRPTLISYRGMLGSACTGSHSVFAFGGPYKSGS